MGTSRWIRGFTKSKMPFRSAFEKLSIGPSSPCIGALPFSSAQATPRRISSLRSKCPLLRVHYANNIPHAEIIDMKIYYEVMPFSSCRRNLELVSRMIKTCGCVFALMTQPQGDAVVRSLRRILKTLPKRFQRIRSRALEDWYDLDGIPACCFQQPFV